MERLTKASQKEAKATVKEQRAKDQKKKEEAEKKEAEEKKVFDDMGKEHLQKVLEKQGLETKGSKAQLIARIKEAGIDISKALDPDERAAIDEEKAAKAEAKAHLE